MRSLFFLPLLALAACSFKLGDDSPGALGNARFEYQSDGCAFGCGLDKTALQGSRVTIVATTSDPSKAPQKAFFDSPTIGTIAYQMPSVTNSNGESSFTINVDIETTGAGDGTLEIVDAKGNVIDRATVHVQPAARIDLSVSVADKALAPKGDTYEIAQNQSVKLGAAVYGADGQPLVFTQHGVSHDYADKTIVRPDDKVLFGSTDVEDMVSGRAGDTTVTVRATGASAVAKFHVLP